MDFEELKRRSGDIELDYLLSHIRFDIGKHKNTKLKRALGRKWRSTLLNNNVASTHQGRLLKQFTNRWGYFTKVQQQERLRLWTVLGSMRPLDVDQILDAVRTLETQLNRVLASVKGVEVIGVFEIEIVSIPLMRQFADHKIEDEARKFNVCESMRTDKVRKLFDEPRTDPGSYALVHFHGVIDLGNDSVAKEEKLRAASKPIWGAQYQAELKHFFATKSVRANLAHIASYLVKGGNETLHYKIGFGRDSVERLEARMMKKGKKDLGDDFEGFDNPLSLTVQEVKILGDAIDRLMSRNKGTMRNGYLFRYGQQVKWVR